MKAKKKPFKKMTLKDLGLEDQVKPRQEILKVAEPPKREGGAKVCSAPRCGYVRFLLTRADESSYALIATGGERRRAHLEAQGGWPHLRLLSKLSRNRARPGMSCLHTFQQRNAACWEGLLLSGPHLTVESRSARTPQNCFQPRFRALNPALF
jgi:hypothetical protein